MAPSRDLVAHDDETVDRTQQYLMHVHRHGGRASARQSSPGRCTRRPAAPGGSPRATGACLIKRLARALRPVVEHAAECGVRLAIEPLNRYETSVINTVEQGLEVVAAVDSPACGLLLDTYHMNIEEKDPAAAIRAAGASHRALPRLRQRPRRAGCRPHATGRRSPPASATPVTAATSCIESFTAKQRVDRDRSLDLAAARAVAGRDRDRRAGLPPRPSVRRPRRRGTRSRLTPRSAAAAPPPPRSPSAPSS